MPEKSPNVPVSVLFEFTQAALLSTGLRDADAKVTAEALVSTDALGVFTHGTKLLAGYLKKLQGGGYSPKAQPRIEREGPAWAVVDGDTGLGQVGCQFAMQTAMQKASTTGVAFVSLRNTGHIGAAGHFAGRAARSGFVTMVTGNDIPSVAAPGSKKAVLGSNPLAYAIHSTALAPMAGHKGYGLGLWCEVMSALIPGGAMTWQVGSWMFDPASRPSWHNASITVFHVDAMTNRADFNARMKTLIDEIHAAPAADGVESVLLPGEREWKNSAAAHRDGIPLPEDVRTKLREASEIAGIVFPGNLLC